MLDKIGALSPVEFENLVYDCVRASGLRNLVWRTPGADGGRDIEGVWYTRDLSGHDTPQRWYIECKRYASTLDWATVWKKIAFADSHRADVLLVVTNNNPSPQCETEVNNWNTTHRAPLVRFWRGYDLPRIIMSHPGISLSYGLSSGLSFEAEASFPMALFLSKIAQAAYVAQEFGSSNDRALLTLATVSELLSQRLSDVKRYGRFVTGAAVTTDSIFEWVDSSGTATKLEEVGVRAILAALRYFTAADRLRVEFRQGALDAAPYSMSHPLSTKAVEDINLVLSWAMFDCPALDLQSGKVSIVGRGA